MRKTVSILMAVFIMCVPFMVCADYSADFGEGIGDGFTITNGNVSGNSVESVVFNGENVLKLSVGSAKVLSVDAPLHNMDESTTLRFVIAAENVAGTTQYLRLITEQSDVLLYNKIYCLSARFLRHNAAAAAEIACPSKTVPATQIAVMRNMQA
jgi:hypothetical protein